MREIEAKVLEVNEGRLRKKLRELGAKKASTQKLHSVYFDFPGRGLEKKRTALRLRSENGRAVLCVKSKRRKSRLKNLDEFEVEVSDFKKAMRMIKLLGFSERLTIKKTRESFRLGPATIEFDHIPGIPKFIEIESSSEKNVLAAAKLLGFGKKDLRPWNAFRLLKHYGKLKGQSSILPT